MSEQHKPKGAEHFKAPKEAEHEPAHHEAAPEHQPRHKSKELEPVHQLEHKAKEEAVAGKELVSHEKAGHESPLYVQKELKEDTWNRTMTRVRKRLPATSRAFSKVVHQPVVDAVSRVGEKTIARPSGLLMGGLCALIGSSFFLWMAKHYGFRYNYLLFFMFFVGGFAVGLIIEMLLWALRRKKTS